LLRQTAGLFRGDAPFHPSERTICDEKRKRPFNAARCVAVSLSVVTVHLIVLSQSASHKVQTFIFERNGLQNHKNCGFAATGSFENSKIFDLKLSFLSTSQLNLFSVLEFELIRT